MGGLFGSPGTKRMVALSKRVLDDILNDNQQREIKMRATKIQKTVEHQLNSLRELMESGLQPYYKSVNEFLYDFYPDFSWSHNELHEEIRAMLVHPEFEKVSTDFKARFDFDIKAELETALTNNDE